ncbi:hypothetical protein KJ980_03255 [Patescibacteria group bacterium]|nr:hypothetical protein [Patescibacteria group bacterium]MBU4016043.1 hypothetical protein [Patescibacteria group bacterium]MBU4098644.1 hypothetical protein [Patescibacteria group bacterium]
MYTYLKPFLVREELLKRNIKIFTPDLFSRVFGTSKEQSKYFLENQVKEGLLARLKKGIYTLKTDFPAEEEIANALYKPSYISFEYALAYYDMLPEMPYIVTSATTKPTRLFNTPYMSFAYYTIKREAYSGYSLIKSGEKSFLMAEPEKALVDYLYFESIGKKPYNDRLILKGLDKNKLLDYADLYQRKSLNETVKEIVKKYYDNS